MNHNLKYGLTIGTVSIASSLAMLLIDYRMLANSWLGILPMVINIAVLLVAGFELRKQHGGYLSFRDAFVSTFIIIAIGAAMSTVYNILVYNVFATDVAAALHEQVISSTAMMLEKFGLEDDIIDQTVTELEASNPYGAGNLLLGYFYTLVGGLILSLIIAAIVRKKPMFEE